jgi:hypothetical protein
MPSGSPIGLVRGIAFGAARRLAGSATTFRPLRSVDTEKIALWTRALETQSTGLHESLRQETQSLGRSIREAASVLDGALSAGVLSSTSSSLYRKLIRDYPAIMNARDIKASWANYRVGSELVEIIDLAIADLKGEGPLIPSALSRTMLPSSLLLRRLVEGRLAHRLRRSQ